MMRILLLGADLDSTNHGVNALSIGTLTALAHQYPNGFHVDILNLGGGPEYEDVLTINGVRITLQKHKPGIKPFARTVVIGNMLRLIPFSIGSRWLAKRDILAELVHSTEVAIDLSEGDSFSDIYGNIRFLVHFLYKMLPGIADVPLFIFPQTIGPFYSRLNRALARLALNRAKLVFTREPYSTQIVSQLIRDKNKLVEASDMAFLMDSKPIKMLPNVYDDEGYIGINVSGLLFFTDDPERLAWTPVLYQNFMNALVEQFILQEQRRVVIIPHVRGTGDVTYADEDIQASRQLIQQLAPGTHSRVHLIEEPLNAQELKYIISRSDFFVGARMHACLAALSSCVPLVPVSYSHKFQGVLAQLGMEDLVCSPKRQNDVDAMLKHVIYWYINRDLIRERLAQVVPAARERALQCAASLQ